MKRNIEQRISAMEKRHSSLKIKLVVMFCPHELYGEEKPPCEDCDHAKNPVRACIRGIMPGQREQ